MPKQKIETSDIASAEKLLGIEYTKCERDQMVENLEGQILSAKMRRTTELDNTVPMASRFDPRLPGFSMPAGSYVKTKSQSSLLPDSEEDIAFATVGELGHWIKNGQITSRKLTEIY